MSLSTAMMVARQPPVTAVTMKMILRTTTKRVAVLLGQLRTIARRTGARSRRKPARRPPVPPAVELMRVPAYMRRRRLTGRLRASSVPASMRRL